MEMIFDTHAHYDDEAFDSDREELLMNLRNKQVDLVVNVAANLEGCQNTLDLINKYDFLYGSIGVHPSDTAQLKDSDYDWLKACCSNEKIVAVGEIGLDYHYDEPDISIQKDWFVKQINLAKEVKLPLIIHSRDAAKDTLDIMKAENARECGGVIHCFSYEKEMAKIYLEMGFYLGIGGVVTFKNTRKLKEVVELSPIEQIVLETDSPYLSPEPNRGRRNDSSNLIFVANEIARIKNISPEEVISITRSNAKRMYGIEK